MNFASGAGAYVIKHFFPASLTLCENNLEKSTKSNVIGLCEKTNLEFVGKSRGLYYKHLMIVNDDSCVVSK
jgi:hypothetical protein